MVYDKTTFGHPSGARSVFFRFCMDNLSGMLGHFDQKCLELHRAEPQNLLKIRSDRSITSRQAFLIISFFICTRRSHFYTRSLWLPSHFVTVSCLHRAVQSATMSLGLCGLQVNTFKRLDWKVLFSFELWKCSDKTVCNFVEYYTPCGFSMPPHESFVKKKITFASSSIYLKSRGISNTACSAVPRKSILHY